MARLTIISDPEKPSFAVEGDVYSVGRSKDNNLVLNSSQVSRRHAELRKNGEGFRIVDLKSMNGVYVNNLKVEDESLAHGDVIAIGDYRLLFEDMRTHKTGVEVMAEPSSAGIQRPDQESAGIADIGKITAASPDGPRFEAEVLFTLETPQFAPTVKIEDLAHLSHRRKLLLLYQVSSIFNSAKPLDELFQQTLDLIFQEVKATEGTVFLFNQEGALDTRVRAAAKGEPGSDLALARAVTERAIKESSSIACAGECLHPSGGQDSGGQGRSVICTLLQTQDKVLGAICLENLADARAFGEDDLDLLTAISNQVAIAVDRDLMQESLRQGVLQRANLERFHSPDVVSHIIQHSKGDKAFRGFLQEREVSILFADIADFTSLIERLEPQEAADLINEYFDAMTEVVFKYKGTVDKFIGDAVMGIFGAPISYGNDAELALFSAIEMMQAMERINAGNDGRKKFNIRIGINTGVVLSGYMGSKQRIEYTVLGDPVNVAARLQHIAEPKAILVGADTYAHVKGIFKFNDRGTTVLRGKRKETRFYEIIY
ncbi:MAG TPA: adenylate/guanylate cyclase domain-containing protein [bacterium]|nr:adenylate/guanylate cyclase domain-containing protein [bacterium]